MFLVNPSAWAQSASPWRRVSDTYRTYMRIYHPMDHEILQAMEKGEQHMGKSWRGILFGETEDMSGIAPLEPIAPAKKKKERRKKKKTKERGATEEMAPILEPEPEMFDEPNVVLSTDADFAPAATRVPW